MARQRMIKPEFFDSESLAECCWGARLAFIGLMVYADDQGNLKLSLGRLRSHIFDDECTDEEFAVMLAQLEDVDCIRIYTDGRKAYVNIMNFGTYQTINHPSKTNIPKPNGDGQTHVFKRLLDATGMDTGVTTVPNTGATHPNELSKELINERARGGDADAPPAPDDWMAASPMYSKGGAV